MKILQVTPAFVPSRFGGVKTVSYDLSKALLGKGHEVTVYTTDADLGRNRLKNVKNIRSVEGLGIRYFRNVSNRLGAKYRLFLPINMVPAAAKEIKNFDVVHLHEFRSFPSVVAHHYAKKYGVPYVLDAHGSTPRVHGGKGFKWLLRCLFDIAVGYAILRDAARVIAETEVGVKEYQEFHISADKIVLISPPFPTNDFAVLPPRGLFRKKYNLEGKPVVMFLGRIHWIKGLDFLAKGFAEVARENTAATLVIVGPDDGYKPTLEALIKELGISDRVIFTGYQGGTDKLSALVDADIVIQTSVYEQGAWAPLEAVLCNTPIIVSSNSGAGEDVKRIDAGYLVEYGNNLELKNMIQYILNNPEEARAKAQKAKEYIKTNMSMATGVEKYIKVYTEITERAKR